jgi:ATP-dependent Zn protease
MAEDIDFDAVADVTDGMVGAQLANLLDVAALNVLRDGRTEVWFQSHRSFCWNAQIVCLSTVLVTDNHR